MSNQIQLERLHPRHAEAFFEAVQSSRVQVAMWLGDQMAPASPEATRTFIDDWSRSWELRAKYGFVAMEHGAERCVGFGLISYVHEHYRIANLGYWARSDAAGRGYATKIALGVAAFGFDALGLVRLELVVEPENIASRRIADKVGAVEEGLLKNRLTINGDVRSALMFGLVPDDLDRTALPSVLLQ